MLGAVVDGRMMLKVVGIVEGCIILNKMDLWFLLGG